MPSQPQRRWLPAKGPQAAPAAALQPDNDLEAGGTQPQGPLQLSSQDVALVQLSI